MGRKLLKSKTMRINSRKKLIDLNRQFITEARKLLLSEPKDDAVVKYIHLLEKLEFELIQGLEVFTGNFNGGSNEF